jgi:hypothetical protein
METVLRGLTGESCLVYLDQCSATGAPSQGERCDANFYLLQEINFRILFVLFYPSYRVSYACILFSATALMK